MFISGVEVRLKRGWVVMWQERGVDEGRAVAGLCLDCGRGSVLRFVSLLWLFSGTNFLLCLLFWHCLGIFSGLFPKYELSQLIWSIFWWCVLSFSFQGFYRFPQSSPSCILYYPTLVLSPPSMPLMKPTKRCRNIWLSNFRSLEGKIHQCNESRDRKSTYMDY